MGSLSTPKSLFGTDACWLLCVLSPKVASTVPKIFGCRADFFCAFTCKWGFKCSRKINVKLIIIMGTENVAFAVLLHWLSLI